MKKIWFECRYRIAMALIGLVRLIPYPVAVLTGRMLGVLIWAVCPMFRRVAHMQMKAALGAGRYGLFSLRMAMHLGRIPVDVIKCLYMTEEELLRKIEFIGLENMQTALASGRGVMCISAHIGNWELVGHLFNFIKQDFHVLTDIRSDARMDSFVRLVRGRLPHFIIEPPRGGMVEKASRILRQGGHVGLMVDMRGKQGIRIFCDMLGLPAPASPAPALIAIKGDAIVVPVHALAKGNSFQIIMDAPIDTRDYARAGQVTDKLVECRDSEPIQHLSARMQDWVSSVVRKNPTQWVWLYSRWLRRADLRRVMREGTDFRACVMEQHNAFLAEQGV